MCATVSFMYWDNLQAIQIMSWKAYCIGIFTCIYIDNLFELKWLWYITKLLWEKSFKIWLCRHLQIFIISLISHLDLRIELTGFWMRPKSYFLEPLLHDEEEGNIFPRIWHPIYSSSSFQIYLYNSVALVYCLWLLVTNRIHLVVKMRFQLPVQFDKQYPGLSVFQLKHRVLHSCNY